MAYGADADAPIRVEDAAELLALATSRPGAALAAARGLLAGRPGPRVRTYCHHAIGIVLRDRDDLKGALRALRNAMSTAERHGLTDRAADIGGTLGTALMLDGRLQQALETFDVALTRCSGEEAAKVLMRRGAVLDWLGGRSDEALRDFRTAVRVFRAHDNLVWEAKTLGNRAFVWLATGRYDKADQDLAASEDIERRLDQPYGVATARFNRADVARLRGDLPVALQHLDTAERTYAETGDPPPPALVALRGQVLAEAGLYPEALQSLEQAHARLGGSRGSAARRAEVAIKTARVAFAVGDLQLTATRAREARLVFQRLGHEQLAGQARLVELQAVAALPTQSRRFPQQVRELAANRSLTWPDAVEASLLAGRVLLDVPGPGDARGHLEAGTRARRRGTPLTRSRGWLATAIRAEVNGRRFDVLRACERGLDVLDEHRLTLGATEMRAAATAHGAELAELGLRHALADGDPRLLLMWSERWRATALAIPPIRPPDDGALASDLAALREVSRRLADGASGSGPLDAERHRLEESIRDRTLRTRGEGSVTIARTDPDELISELDGATIVEVVAVDGGLQVLVTDRDGVRRHPSGSLELAAKEVDLVRFSLHQLARGSGAAAMRRAAEKTLPASARRLEEMLLDGACDDLGDGPLVVVPPGRLHAVPWGLLPSLRKRAVSVAPSAAVWLRGKRLEEPEGRRIALVAGPDLESAGGEVPHLAELYPEATLLHRGGAVAEDVLAALDGASLAHVAAHGTFRADNPMFSSLRMDDGPLTVHDLCRLKRAPYRLILSSCESGLAAPTGADELLGLTSALVPLGTVSLLASVVPVNDEASVPLMGTVHAHLRKGSTLAESLREARLEAADGDPVAAATAAAFVALGSA